MTESGGPSPHWTTDDLVEAVMLMASKAPEFVQTHMRRF
jgi:hypothetical protein